MVKEQLFRERMKQRSSESYGGAHENVNMLYQNYICVNDTIAG